ncbi:VanZ family protein [Streptomyces yaizuensis]|uniref:VanZ family protein n=1 Tax=Streptomyces yaizuensis TaxID=2989713 RepID=UPI002B20FB31|nr:VanZ family protein [Streptomyces sp. YSPA8]
MRAVGVLLLLAHLLLVCWLTLRPLDVPWVTPANLELLAGIRADLELPPRDAALRLGGGLLLLAPLGVLLPLVSGRLMVSPVGSLARTVTAGALISLAIELLQTGVPGRVLDVDSLLLNTAGVMLAHLLVVPSARARLRRRRARLRDRSPAASSAQPRPRFRAVAQSAPMAPLMPSPVRRPGSGGGPLLREEGSPPGPTPRISRVGIAP